MQQQRSIVLAALAASFNKNIPIISSHIGAFHLLTDAGSAPSCAQSGNLVHCQPCSFSLPEASPLETRAQARLQEPALRLRLLPCQDLREIGRSAPAKTDHKPVHRTWFRAPRQGLIASNRAPHGFSEAALRSVVLFSSRKCSPRRHKLSVARPRVSFSCHCWKLVSCLLPEASNECRVLGASPGQWHLQKDTREDLGMKTGHLFVSSIIVGGFHHELGA